MPEAADFDSTFENKWCPGCGNFGILNAMKKGLAAAGILPHRILIVSGIGQAAKTPHFLKCNYFHGLHGRALPVATGAKIAHHALTILVNTGDGDCYGEGGNHFITAVRRNIDLTVLVHNNKVYGLTKGQASPTSDLDMKTRAQPHGVILEPFNGLSVALALQCGFVARGYSGNLDQLSGLIQEAIAHNGFSLVDILQPCVSYNHINTYQFYNDRVYDLAEQNHDSSDYAAACEKAREWGDRIPTGILYKKKSDSFTDKIQTLQKGPLLDREYDKQKLDAILAQL